MLFTRMHNELALARADLERALGEIRALDKAVSLLEQREAVREAKVEVQLQAMRDLLTRARMSHVRSFIGKEDGDGGNLDEINRLRGRRGA